MGGDTGSVPRVAISRRGEERLDAGHLWVYRSDVIDVAARGGDTVRLIGPRNRPLGWALYSDRSEIAIRLLTVDDEPADLELWRARLARAIDYRSTLAIDATAYRLVHAEGDLLPSLVVDRYGGQLVVQALSQGVERLLPDLCRILVDLVHPDGLLVRNDARVRLLEGLPLAVEVAHGHVPDVVVVREGPVEYEVDLRSGQKTGLFLDQRETRIAAAAYAKGRALDCFSYHGGFALHMARAAADTLAIDSSEEAVAVLRRNAARNGAPRLEARVANVFDVLADFDRAGERFDTIVLDPPAFAKRKAALARAVAGYKEINLRALRILNPGGHLVTCTCSYHVSEAAFGSIVFEAALDAGTRVVVVERRMQSRDHPILLGVPETHYLKGLILRTLE
jgi:23S rRNA (cytosine1962-C5)-methyltransferase